MEYPVRILERAAASLPGIASGLLQAELHALLMDFCRHTRAWRYVIEGMTIRNGRLDLGAYTAPGYVLGVIGALWYREWQPIMPLAQPWMGDKPTGDPQYFHTEPSSHMRLIVVPVPADDVPDVRCEVYLAPFETACHALPDELYLHYEDALIAGLVGRMQMISKKPYTDIKEGAARMAIYRAGCRQARIQAGKGRTGATAPWTYPKFA